MEENRNTSFQLKGRDMDSILQSLEEGVSEVFTSERYTEYLQTKFNSLFPGKCSCAESNSGG